MESAAKCMAKSPMTGLSRRSGPAPSCRCLAISSRHCCRMGVGHTMSVAPQSAVTSASARARQQLPHSKPPASTVAACKITPRTALDRRRGVSIPYEGTGAANCAQSVIRQRRCNLTRKCCEIWATRTCSLGEAQAGCVLPGGTGVTLQPQPRVFGVRHSAAHAVHTLPPLDALRLWLLRTAQKCWIKHATVAQLSLTVEENCLAASCSTAWTAAFSRCPTSRMLMLLAAAGRQQKGSICGATHLVYAGEAVGRHQRQQLDRLAQALQHMNVLRVT